MFPGRMGHGTKKIEIIILLVIVLFSLFWFSNKKTNNDQKPLDTSGYVLVKVPQEESQTSSIFNKVKAEKVIKAKDYEWKKVTLSELEKLKSENPRVSYYTQRDLIRKPSIPDDSFYNSNNNVIAGQFDQWNLRKIQLTPLPDVNSGWSVSTGSESTIIAVIDTGLVLTNPDIVNFNSGSSTWGENNLWINQDEIPVSLFNTIDTNTDTYVSTKELIEYFVANSYDVNGDSTVNYLDIVANGSVIMDGVDQDGNSLNDDIFGYNFADLNPNVNDTVSGHGTHVAGIIAATTGNNVSVNPGIAGICWTCKIMPLRVINNSGFGYDSDITSAISYAVNKGARIINMSLGGEGYSQILQDAIDFAWDNNVLVVSASGNDYGDASDSYPGGASRSISVGATNYQDSIPSYSNQGQKLDLVAPGSAILSTYRNVNGCVGLVYYNCSSGTSMATPHVSGVAALLADLHKNDPDWDVVQLRQAILNNTDDLFTTGFDNASGFGLLQAKSVLDASLMPEDITDPVVSISNSTPIYARNTFNVYGTANDDNLYIYTISLIRESDLYVVKQYSSRTSVISDILLQINSTNFSDGLYYIQISAEDYAGNLVSSAPYQIRIDNTAPSSFTPITPGNNSATNDSTPSITWNTSTDVSPVTYDINLSGNVIVTNLSTTNYTIPSPISEGLYNYFIIAKDAAGNTRNSSTHNFTVDSTPPQSFAPQANINLNNAQITFAANDNLSVNLSYKISINGSPFTDAISPVNYTNLNDGQYTLTVRALDSAGNQRDGEVVFTINARTAILKSKADFNFDGKVDLSDLSILATYWNQTNTVADANNDNKTDLSDLSILATNWNQTF